MCDSQSGTGTTTTGTRLPDTTFKNAQANGLPIQDLHEADIDSSREACMTFDQWPQTFYLGGIDIIDAQQNMRITDAGSAHLKGLASDIQVIEMRLHVGQKRDTGRLEHRHPHLDHNLSIVL